MPFLDQRSQPLSICSIFPIGETSEASAASIIHRGSRRQASFAVPHVSWRVSLLPPSNLLESAAEKERRAEDAVCGLASRDLLHLCVARSSYCIASHRFAFLASHVAQNSQTPVRCPNAMTIAPSRRRQATAQHCVTVALKRLSLTTRKMLPSYCTPL